MTGFLHDCVWIGIAASLVILSQVMAVRVCKRNAALARWSPLVAGIVLLWCLVVVLKVTYLDVDLEQGDGYGHERMARSIAAHLANGEFALAMDYFRPGNDGYRFMLGVFYALTDAPPGFTYAINGALGFWGMLALLEILCRSTGCTRVPWWVVVMTVGLPSAVYWTTANMKEGPVLWGICMMLGFGTRVRGPSSRSQSVLLPLAGFLTTAFLRPHIAAAWLGSIATSHLICRKKIVPAVFCGAGIVIAFFLLQIVAPEHMASAQEDGVTAMMSERYEYRYDGGSAIYRSHPVIPVASGLMLILFRPLPYECEDMRATLAGAEVWLMSSVLLWGWVVRRNYRRALSIPLVVTSLIATIGLSFFFSYMFNMGLMARQRIQVLPAFVVLAAVPFLLSVKRSSYRHGLRRVGIRRIRHLSGVLHPPKVVQGKRHTLAR